MSINPIPEHARREVGVFWIWKEGEDTLIYNDSQRDREIHVRGEPVSVPAKTTVCIRPE